MADHCYHYNDDEDLCSIICWPILDFLAEIHDDGDDDDLCLIFYPSVILIILIMMNVAQLEPYIVVESLHHPDDDNDAICQDLPH